MKHRHLITVIRRSCLTGAAVWVYQGPSRSAAMRAYHRACVKEVRRVRQWVKTAEQRMSNVASLMAACQARLPAGARLTPEQAAAARRLKAIQETAADCHMEFYDHIMEERRRRKIDRQNRRTAIEREKQRNRDYGKQ